MPRIYRGQPSWGWGSCCFLLREMLGLTKGAVTPTPFRTTRTYWPACQGWAVPAEVRVERWHWWLGDAGDAVGCQFPLTRAQLCIPNTQCRLLGSLKSCTAQAEVGSRWQIYREAEKRRPNSSCSTWCNWPCTRAVNVSPHTSMSIHLFQWEATWLSPNISRMSLRCTSVGEGLFQPFHSLWTFQSSCFAGSHPCTCGRGVQWPCLVRVFCSPPIVIIRKKCLHRVQAVFSASSYGNITGKFCAQALSL